MDCNFVHIVAVVLGSYSIGATVALGFVYSQRDEARDMAGFIAQAVEDIARGKAKAFMHMGRVHITNDMGE